MTGAEPSTQYIAVIGYTSLINRQQKTVKIEVGLREKDFAEFDLDRAYRIVTDVAAMVG
jgi:hypothetical protein